MVCLPPVATVAYWNQPASLIVPQPVAYRSFDTLDGLTLMEEVQQANFDTVVSGKVCFPILKCYVMFGIDYMPKVLCVYLIHFQDKNAYQ